MYINLFVKQNILQHLETVLQPSTSGLTTVILATEEAESRRVTLQGQPRQKKKKSKTPSQKYPTEERGRMAQVVEHLPSPCKIQSSNPSTSPISLQKKGIAECLMILKVIYDI
jgi:hypothetical protein